MNNMVRVGIASAIIGTVTVGAHAQTVVPFNGSTAISGGTLVTSGGATGSVVSVTGVTTNLSNTYAGAFTSGLYSIDFSAVTNSVTIRDSASVTVLSGTISTITNLYSDTGNPNGPVVTIDGWVSFTSGTWLDPIRQLTAGSVSNQVVAGYLSLSGNNGTLPPGVDTVFLEVSAVPEPSEWAAIGMLGTGLAGLVLRARRKLSN